MTLPLCLKATLSNLLRRPTGAHALRNLGILLQISDPNDRHLQNCHLCFPRAGVVQLVVPLPFALLPGHLHLQYKDSNYRRCT